MGLLMRGKWVDQWYDTQKTGGHFVRASSSFREQLGSDRFPAEVNRYHLYVSHACPWAHRVVIFRKLKKLEDIISLSVVSPMMGENGWEFGSSGDPVNGKDYLYQVYVLAEPEFSGRVTVPVLWDRQEETIVNNESSEIIRMFNDAFNHLTDDHRDFYPTALRDEINQVNQFIYHSINNGVYKAGFATEQAVYEKEVSSLFAALDELEQRLAGQRYLVGDQLSEADIRLFTTLIRFDSVYVGHFKCNIRRVADYPILSSYLRDIYQTEGIGETVHFFDIKAHYYQSHLTINPNQIIPLGPELLLDAPHDRAKL